MLAHGYVKLVRPFDLDSSAAAAAETKSKCKI